MNDGQRDVLADMLRCPGCASVALARVEGGMRCNACGTFYLDEEGIPRLVPDPLPESLGARFDLWMQLQRNGEVSYKASPELNLTGANSVAMAVFRDRVELAGRVLDVGCGPTRAHPAYMEGQRPTLYVGLDPLRGAAVRKFPFIYAIGERMPIRNAMFDHVLLVSSLDHMLDFRVALREVGRVLRDGGRVHILADQIEPDPGGGRVVGPWRRGGHIVYRGIRQVWSGVRMMGLARTVRYVRTIAMLGIPQGARDFFHTELPAVEGIKAALAECGFAEVKETVIDGEVEVLIQGRMERRVGTRRRSE